MRLFRLFWEICLLRVRPQDLPCSASLLALSLAGYFAVGVLLALLQLPKGQAFPAALLDTFMLSVLAWVVLWSRGLSGRYTQTLTALAGSGAMLGLLALPLLSWQMRSLQTSDDAVTLPALLILIWTGWNLGVVAHILRHALSTLFVVGVALALAYMYIVWSIMNLIFTPAG